GIRLEPYAMSQEMINIVFGKLAKTTLAHALAMRQKQEQILTFPDDLSFGPINPPWGSQRLKWIADNFHLSASKWDVFPNQLERLVSLISAPDAKIICWICPNSVYEYCGFSEIIYRTPGKNFYLINTMSFDFTQSASAKVSERAAARLAHLSPAMA